MFAVRVIVFIVVLNLTALAEAGWFTDLFDSIFSPDTTALQTQSNAQISKTNSFKNSGSEPQQNSLSSSDSSWKSGPCSDFPGSKGNNNFNVNGAFIFSNNVVSGSSFTYKGGNKYSVCVSQSANGNKLMETIYIAHNDNCEMFKQTCSKKTNRDVETYKDVVAVGDPNGDFAAFTCKADKLYVLQNGVWKNKVYSANIKQRVQLMTKHEIMQVKDEMVKWNEFLNRQRKDKYNLRDLGYAERDRHKEAIRRIAELGRKEVQRQKEFKYRYSDELRKENRRQNDVNLAFKNMERNEQLRQRDFRFVIRDMENDEKGKQRDFNRRIMGLQRDEEGRKKEFSRTVSQFIRDEQLRQNEHTRNMNGARKDGLSEAQINGLITQENLRRQQVQNQLTNLQNQENIRREQHQQFLDRLQMEENERKVRYSQLLNQLNKQETAKMDEVVITINELRRQENERQLAERNRMSLMEKEEEQKKVTEKRNLDTLQSEEEKRHQLQEYKLEDDRKLLEKQHYEEYNRLISRCPN